MDDIEKEPLNTEIAEIERLIAEFKQKFAAGTSDADDFMTIAEIEMIWGELQSKTNNIYSDLMRKLMSEVDEKELIRKKNSNSNSKG